mmetsp:Transcript_17618/g.41380  ORF Transcript_17618/g.41380 Transcript_17618/m.41380 type:complete len:459 (+) Transcript_17618:71-1447(+)
MGSQDQGLVICGFPCCPEPESLRIQADRIAPFTLPVEALSFNPTAEMVVYQFRNGDKERKIHCNVKLTDQEHEQLRLLREEVRRKAVTFMPSIAVMATRFISRARGDIHKALKLMEATNTWRHNFFGNGPVMDTEVMEDMQHGIVYFCGRDNALRPTIVVRATRIPNQWYKEKRIDKMIRILIFCMEYMIRYMLVPGRIENNCLIVDLKGLTLAQVPLGALSEIYSVMSHHYIGRVFKFYICNLSSTLSTIAGMAKNILTDRQKQKLVFVDNVKDLQKEFASHHLEEDLGGTRPVLSKFFPFPLLAGPFEGGCQNGADSTAVPFGHDVLTPTGARGRLWDTQATREQNTQLDYTPSAAEFYERCGLELPPGCASQRQAASQQPPEPEASPEAPPAEEPKLAPRSAIAEESDCIEDVIAEDLHVEDDRDEVIADEDFVVQGAGVKPRGPFSCMPCCCAK